MLQEKVLQTINKYHLIKENDYIVLGVSGGPDSTCLFHIFLELQKQIKFKFVVCHINHGIRKEAIEDEKYVEQMCSKYNIPCYIKKEQVLSKAKDEKLGTEEMGRKVRYEFFLETMQNIGANKIATAHTKNDSVETVLMNILRGCGLSGLKGIEAIRDNTYIRPLIECEKSQIEEYCKQKNLKPCIDKTNFENTYTRNKIRNELIPYMQKEFNPNIIEAIWKMSNILDEQDKYLEQITKNEYEKLLISQTAEEIILDLKKFNEYELVLKNRIILYTVKELFGSSSGIEKVHLEDIIKLCSNNIGNKFLIPNKKIKILVKKQKIFFTNNQ